MRHDHRGSSLLEMVVVISVATVAMALVGNILYGLFRVDQQTRIRLLDSRQLARLSMQFREDVHRAVAVSEQAADRVTLELPQNREILYTSQGHRIERRVKEGQSVLHRDTFQFSADLDAHWEQGDGEVVRALRLCIWKRLAAAAAGDEQSRATAGSRLIRCIEAVPGLDNVVAAVARESQESTQ